MNPLYIKVPVQPSSSFNVRKELAPNINSRWHYHPEAELIHFENGGGVQFVGDNIRPFLVGDVVLVGPNLPHYWRFDSYATPATKQAYSTVVHFAEDFCGSEFIKLCELQKVKSLIEKSRQGILLRGKSAEGVASLMDVIFQSQGFSRLISLLEALYVIAEADYEVLTSPGFDFSPSTVSDTRIRNVVDYSLKCLNEKIDLKSVASIAGLTENSFCRFFKSTTGKTYFEFLTEARIGQACKLLMEGHMSIKEVCFNSGFDNLSCFFTKFKVITGKTPLQYKREIE